MYDTSPLRIVKTIVSKRKERVKRGLKCLPRDRKKKQERDSGDIGSRNYLWVKVGLHCKTEAQS